ncbi:MAG: glycosyltransferase family 2 protein, partial [Candidatus Heimdallarchaeota archaeon]
MKIRIDVPCYNRKKITELCLRQLNKAKIENTQIRIYNDNSTEYDNEWLEKWGTPITFNISKQQRWINIHTIRYLAYQQFLNEDFDYLYMTDNDAFHTPQFLSVFLNLSRQYNLPVCGYISKYMSEFSNQYRLQTNTNATRHVVKNTNGGISVFLTRKHVQKLMKKYNSKTRMWDCDTWALLNNQYILTGNSFLEHFGKGGLHNQNWNFDYALKPIKYLKKVREPII